jgi:hypothetical protein
MEKILFCNRSEVMDRMNAKRKERRLFISKLITDKQMSKEKINQWWNYNLQIRIKRLSRKLQNMLEKIRMQNYNIL